MLYAALCRRLPDFTSVGPFFEHRGEERVRGRSCFRFDSLTLRFIASMRLMTLARFSPGDGQRLLSALGFDELAQRGLVVVVEAGGFMIRKLKSGEFRLYSRKKDASTGKRRNLGTFSTLEKAKQHEREVQYFKKH
jgi:hypothetical protein